MTQLWINIAAYLLCVLVAARAAGYGIWCVRQEKNIAGGAAVLLLAAAALVLPGVVLFVL